MLLFNILSYFSTACQSLLQCRISTLQNKWTSNFNDLCLQTGRKGQSKLSKQKNPKHPKKHQTNNQKEKHKNPNQITKKNLTTKENQSKTINSIPVLQI